LIPKPEEVIAQHGKVRCVLYMDEAFQGWELGAMSDDMHCELKHRNEIEKTAVVGRSRWVE
jgi:hypothetical protein